MPKQPIDYSKSIIYKIYCNNPEIKDVYVGSTTNFIKRKTQHKNTSKNEKDKDYNIKLYKKIRDNGGWDNYSMIPIIEYSCDNKIQLLIEEEKYRKELNAELNSVKCILATIEEKKEANKEYKINNKDKIKEQNKIYRENNKDKINEYFEKNKNKIKEQRKENYEKNKEQIKEQSKQNYHKYKDNNNEQLLLRQRDYHKKNKDAINARRREIAKIKRENALIMTNHI